MGRLKHAGKLIWLPNSCVSRFRCPHSIKLQPQVHTKEHTYKLQHQLTIPPQVLGATTHYLRLYSRRRGQARVPPACPRPPAVILAAVKPSLGAYNGGTSTLPLSQSNVLSFLTLNPIKYLQRPKRSATHQRSAHDRSDRRLIGVRKRDKPSCGHKG